MNIKKNFLATTANQEFWDTSGQLIFLGEWCKRYDKKMFWQDIDTQTFAYCFNAKEADKTQHYLDELFERLLLVLHKQMNLVCGTNFSLRYWRIILSSWLIHYIMIMRDRYSNLKNFIGLYPEFSTICLNKESFITPKDTIHFVSLIKNDDFNLQIYSSILTFLGYEFPVKKLTIINPDVSIYFTGKGNLLKNLLRHGYESVCRLFQNKNQVLLRNTYFSNLSLLKLIIRTRGAAWPCVNGCEDLPDFTVDRKTREALGRVNFGENEFEKMLIHLIPFDIPQSMIEGYSFLKEKVKSNFVAKPKAIMSGISWWFDNAFRVWAAGASESGAPLYGVQHGGGYGLQKNLFPETIELSIVDKFYSWGWERSDAYAKVVSMPAPKLASRRSNSSGRGNGILYVSNSFPVLLAGQFLKDYFSDQSAFILGLSSPVLSAMRIRPHREDMERGMRERISDNFPCLKIEDWSMPFSKSLNLSSMYVTDHPIQSTTFVEALQSNKPTIAFYNPDFPANTIKEEVWDVFMRLKSSKIVFDHPKEAAEQLNSVYGCIEKWWNEPERQLAVNNFLDKFGRTSPVWLNDWAVEIDLILNSNNLKDKNLT